jgi:hypothetical protein
MAAVGQAPAHLPQDPPWKAMHCFAVKTAFPMTKVFFLSGSIFLSAPVGQTEEHFTQSIEQAP